MMIFKTMNLPTYKKIGLVYGILVILLLVAFGVRFMSGNKLKNATAPTKTDTQAIKKENLTGKISLATDKTSYKVGDSIEVTVLYQAPGKVLDGIDIIVRFDPTVVNALGFSESHSFKIYPRKDIDNKDGFIRLTALDLASAEPLPPDKLSLGKIQMQALKGGTAQVNFDFTQGVASKTAMIEAGTSKNILGEAKGVTIRVTQ